MYQKTFIFGITALGKILFYHLRNEGHPPDAFVLDDAFCDCSAFSGMPVIPYSQTAKYLPPEDYAAYVAIGYTGMNAARKAVSRRLVSAGYCLPNYIHPSVINYSAEMGMGNLIFPGVILDVDTRIGDGNIFYPGAMISHDVKLGSYNFFAPRAALAGDITAGDRCFFGLNCSVRNNVRIGDCCLLGASAYAAHDLKRGSVLVPSRSVLLEKDSEEMIKKVMSQ